MDKNRQKNTITAVHGCQLIPQHWYQLGSCGVLEDCIQRGPAFCYHQYLRHLALMTLVSHVCIVRVVFCVMVVVSGHVRILAPVSALPCSLTKFVMVPALIKLMAGVV